MEDGDLIHHKRPGGSTWTRNKYCYDSMCKASGCHTVVKKARFEEQWPNDPAFQNFADRLANAAQTALLDGIRIRRGDQCLKGDCCPLGCLPELRAVGRFRPASGVPGLSDQQTLAFFEAFDHGCGNPADPYVRLGLAYRKRFSQ